VQQISNEVRQYSVVLAIISISRGLNRDLVAEGVETKVQARYLRAHECSTMQGFRFHRLMAVGGFVNVLNS
jgi:EAL domain-containing protein (putative c-di-GMP-specific phosphodiesterase class I)